MGNTGADNRRRRLMTTKEVQEEFLDMDIRKVRAFLNQYCTYKKIGQTYYYSRKEVEELLLDGECCTEFCIGMY